MLQEIDINRVRPIYDDYAVVEKTVIEVKHQQSSLPRPPRPPPPSRRKKTAAQITALKNQGINFFFTYPRRAIKSLQKEMPVRPVRNYSTIGPSRPPRRNRVFREPVYVESEIIPLKGEDEQNDFDLKSSEIEDKIENVERETAQVIENIKELTANQDEVQEARDLQSGDVIEKMKGRPLPPPPRPPRKSKDDNLSRHEEDFRDEENDVQVTDLDDPDDEEIIVQRIDICVTPNRLEEIKDEHLVTESDDVLSTKLSDNMHLPTVLDKPIVVEPPVKVERKRKSLSQPNNAPLIQETVKVEESCVSTQTDPLPEGFLVEEEQQTLEEVPQIRVQAQEPIEKVKHIETVIEKQVIVMPSPDTEVQVLKAQKLQVSELDVDKLNVNELQAQKIVVSDIDGVTMQVSELSSKSGYLVINGIELPPSFLENLIPPSQSLVPVSHEQSSTQTAPPPVTVDSQTNTTPTVAIPDPLIAQPSQTTPSIIVESPQSTQTPVFISSYIPTSTMSQQRSPQQTRAHAPTTQQLADSEEDMCLVPSRRRRHHSHKHSNRFSSDEEEEEDYSKHHPVARRHQQREATAAELARQLINIWQESFLRGVNHVVDGINIAFPEGEKRKDAQTAACIILVLLAGLIMLGLGQDRTVHHHHWDFIPPHP